MNPLPISRACDLATEAPEHQWLIEELWAEEAVGILGGEPKCCKSFLALDMAVSVASGSPCLRRFPVRRTGPVLLFPAEDSLGVVRQRLVGICAAAGTAFDALPLYVITAPRLLLDVPQDRQRLRQAVAVVNPALLVLDPFIRLHRADENASREVAPLLGYLRELQREFHVAVLLVHHVRKRSGKDRPGQALRGSSDLHGWGDSNLYLRRNCSHLRLAIEHRAAPAADDINVDLVTHGAALALSVIDSPAESLAQPASVAERVVQAMAQTAGPLSAQKLRKLCRIRTATLCETLTVLRNQGRVLHGSAGYSLAQTPNEKPVSFPATPIGDTGNGNGKHPNQPQLPLVLNHQLP
ncbi:MAG: AAA family ATPase [Lysobacterales bacterium]|nr:MAG: AAA family ATPase [Xanthomonadales bacterium]